MKNYKLIIVAAFLTLTSCGAIAQNSEMGVFIEPSITYELGDTRISYPAPFSNSSGDINGFGIGARLGLHIYEALFVGADGRYSFPNFKDSSVGYNESAVSTNWGPVIGMQMPDLGLRVWATWVLGGQLDPDGSSNLDVKFNDSNGYRIGAGMRVAFVSLNLEYQKLDYRNTTLEKLGAFTTASVFNSVELENESWMASVSFPLEF
jgi:hypothetical protein